MSQGRINAQLARGARVGGQFTNGNAAMSALVNGLTPPVPTGQCSDFESSDVFDMQAEPVPVPPGFSGSPGAPDSGTGILTAPVGSSPATSPAAAASPSPAGQVTVIPPASAPGGSIGTATTPLGSSLMAASNPPGPDSPVSLIPTSVPGPNGQRIPAWQIRRRLRSQGAGNGYPNAPGFAYSGVPGTARHGGPGGPGAVSSVPGSFPRSSFGMPGNWGPAGSGVPGGGGIFGGPGAGSGGPGAAASNGNIPPPLPSRVQQAAAARGYFGRYPYGWITSSLQDGVIPSYDCPLSPSGSTSGGAGPAGAAPPISGSPASSATLWAILILLGVAWVVSEN